MTALTDIRKWLHRIAEVSGEEQLTAAFIEQELSALDPDLLLTGLGGNGICATFSGAQPGLHLLFRAELDALPITETNTFDHRSTHPGVSHKCGHDGHMAILLGLGRSLSGKKSARGKVSLLFQPAEETGEGAAAVLADPGFAAIQPDRVYALHNIPGFPLGKVLIKSGSITAAVKSMIIRFYGKTSHAAEPEFGYNPAGVLAKTISAIEKLTVHDPVKEDFSLITPVHALLGEKAYGVSAGYAELHLTLRAWNNDRMEHLVSDVTDLLEKQCRGSGITFDFEWTDVFEANSNDPELVAEWYRLAAKNSQEWQDLDLPFKWGEDFGYFTGRCKGVFFGLGAGEDCPALHNPDYDFPDELIEPGVVLFRMIIDATCGD